jgi:hypothetical protein
MELKKVALTLGIAVLFTLFIVFLVDAIYQQPKYEDYCSNNYYGPYPAKFENTRCPIIYNSTLNEECVKNKGQINYKYDNNGCEIEAYCEYCYVKFDDANRKYNKNIFYISALVGIIAILAGLYLPRSIDAIASGFVFGGILVLLQGTVRVFGDLGRYSRVIVLGIELVLLVWIGYKKVKETKKKK